MPVAKTGQAPARQALLVGLAGFVALIGIVLLITQIGQSTTSSDVGLTSGSFFSAGEAGSLAEVIESEGPLPLSDVASGDRDIILQHVGDDDTTGWRAFAARPPTVGRHCVATWLADRQEFELQSQDPDVTDPCPAEIYPADGEGLTQLPVVIQDGIVTIDINAAERSTTTVEK